MEDYDDLLPIIQHAQQQGYPLSKVPKQANPSKDYSIARLIAAQNINNSVLVATVNIPPVIIFVHKLFFSSCNKSILCYKYAALTL